MFKIRFSYGVSSDNVLSSIKNLLVNIVVILSVLREHIVKQISSYQLNAFTLHHGQ